jgi:hypothetical protein
MDNLAARCFRTILMGAVFIALSACSSGGGGGGQRPPDARAGARAQMPPPPQFGTGDDDNAQGTPAGPNAKPAAPDARTTTKPQQNDEQTFVAPQAVTTSQGGTLVGGSAGSGNFVTSGQGTGAIYSGSGGSAGSVIAAGGGYLANGWNGYTGNLAVKQNGGAVGTTPPGANQAPGGPADQPGLDGWKNPNAITNTTGGTDANNSPYSDAYDDQFLGMLRTQMDNLTLPPGSAPGYTVDIFKSRSMDLAKSIKNIWFFTNRNRNSKAIVEFVDQDTQNAVHLTFQGPLSASQVGTLPLIRSLSTDIPLGQTFNLTVVCVDNSPLTCQSAVLILEQLNAQTLVPCKRAYAIHRYGDAHFRINSQSIIDQGPMSSGPYNIFLDYLTKTICFADGILYRDNNYQQVWNAATAKCNAGLHSYPAMEALGLRNWAVAYGDAEFSVVMKETTNVDNSAAANDVGSYMRDVTVFNGPMKAPGGNNGFVGMSPITLRYFSYLENKNNPDEEPQFDSSTGYGGFAQYFRDVLLTYNNGKGVIALHFDFSESESLNMDIISLVYQTMSIDLFTKLAALIQPPTPQEIEAPAPPPPPRPPVQHAAPRKRVVHHHYAPKKQTSCGPEVPNVCTAFFKKGMLGAGVRSDALSKKQTKADKDRCCNRKAFGLVDLGPGIDSAYSALIYQNVCGYYGSDN